MIRRRDVVAISLAGPLLAQSLTIAQRREVFDFAWTFVRDQFYDKSMRGVDWNFVRNQFTDSLLRVETTNTMRSLLRGMLAQLRQSHLSVLTREEFCRSRVVLLFVFGRFERRVFVTQVLPRKDGSHPETIQPGDEILTVDGQPAEWMRLPEVTHLDEMDRNPYSGNEGSSAVIRLRRQGRELSIQLERTDRMKQLRQSELVNLPNGGLLMRLSTSGDGTIDDRDFWQRLGVARFVILDLRHCVGGDATFSCPLLGSLMGAGVVVKKNVPRNGNATIALTQDPGVRCTGRVAVLIGRNTESEPEAIAAALREYGRARLFGDNTGGAWSGFSIATLLPHGVGLLSVPNTRSISPKGLDYERTGVPPDVRAKSSLLDLMKGKDPAMVHAMRYAS